jgi:hypothetical protein
MEGLIALLVAVVIVALVLAAFCGVWGLIAHDDDKGRRLLGVSAFFGIVFLATFIAAGVLKVLAT